MVPEEDSCLQQWVQPGVWHPFVGQKLCLLRVVGILEKHWKVSKVFLGFLNTYLFLMQCRTASWSLTEPWEGPRPQVVNRTSAVICNGRGSLLNEKRSRELNSVFFCFSLTHESKFNHLRADEASDPSAVWSVTAHPEGPGPQVEIQWSRENLKLSSYISREPVDVFVSVKLSRDGARCSEWIQLVFSHSAKRQQTGSRTSGTELKK